MDVLERGSAWLEAQRTKHATRDVTYRRGAVSAVVRATLGRTLLHVDDGYDLLERVETRDYLVLADDLVLGETAVLPERGDRIEEIEADRKLVYEVLAPGKEPVWRYSDPYRRTLRIHAKHVATEVAS